MTEPLGPESELSPEKASASAWQTLLQRAADPLFLLNRRRQVLCVNRAWEQLTGFTASAVRGTRCRRMRDAVPASLESLLTALSPPAEARRGCPSRVRRALPRPNAAPDLLDISFFPLTGPKGRLYLLGKIVPVPRQSALIHQALPPNLMTLRERAVRWYSLEQLPDTDPAQRRLVEQVRLASQLDVPVLLIGETGTGKEWIARTIHHLSSSAERTFAAVDCAQLPPAALTAALFTEPGLCYRAYVGTVYLDEPSRLPRELQTKLCELIASPASTASMARRPRFLAGCSADPVEEIRSGRFLEDLYCALSPLTLTVAPLRERPGDIAFLALRILERLNVGAEQPVTDLATQVWQRFMAYRWPGNVAELHAVLAEMCQRAKGWRIEASHLPWHLKTPAAERKKPLPLKKLLADVERRLVELALQQSGGSKTRAAEQLGILRPVLVQKMKRLGISDS